MLHERAQLVDSLIELPICLIWSVQLRMFIYVVVVYDGGGVFLKNVLVVSKLILSILQSDVVCVE